MTAPTEPRQPSAALSHLRVLDLTRVRAGPTCCRVLADFGADVIKIEPPDGVDPNEGMSGARDGYDMLNLHRNKRSMTLNLKTPQGLAVFMRMVENADIVVENYRPDVKERLGIAYDDLRAVNPRIILASISGFGQDGPYRDRAGFDQIAQGMGGLMCDHRPAGPGPGARRRGGRRFDRRALCRDRHPGGAGRARALRRGPVGPHLAARSADRALRLPGGALSGRRRQRPARPATTIPIRPRWACWRRPTATSISASAARASGGKLCEALERPDLAEHPDYATQDERLRIARR